MSDNEVERISDCENDRIRQHTDDESDGASDRLPGKWYPLLPESSKKNKKKQKKKKKKDEDLKRGEEEKKKKKKHEKDEEEKMEENI